MKRQKSCWAEAGGELRKRDVRQATEKVWGAVTLTVKAYALWREKKPSYAS